MNMSDLIYQFPNGAYLLFFTFLFLVLFWLLYQHRQNIVAKYANENRLSSLLIPQSSYNYWLKVAAFCLAWICLSLALMQPKGNARYPPELEKAQKQMVNRLRLKPHEVIFLIDGSASMKTPDGRLGQTRFENAKEIADQVMSRLQGQSSSLYAFTSAVSKLSPPSMDYLFMRMMLRNMEINEGGINGTDIKSALQYIHDHYLNLSTSLIKTVILISDGEDNRLQLLQGEERTKYIEETVALLGNPEEEKMHVYTVGVGSKKGAEIPQLVYEGKRVNSHLDEDLLKALSTKGNGQYYAGNDFAAIDIGSNLSAHIAEADVFAPLNESEGINPAEDLIYDLYYQFPLGLAILLLALYIFGPETSMLKQNIFSQSLTYTALLAIFLLPTGLIAVENHEEQLRLAEAYFKANNGPAAINIYQSLLKENLTEWERSIVAYNLGTVFATQGNLQKAIEHLQSISIQNYTSPVLTFRVRKNQAVAIFSQAEQLRTEHIFSSSQDPFFKSIYFFKQTLDEAPLAQEAQCNMLRIAGDEACPTDNNLEEMVILSKSGIAEMRLAARQNLVTHASLQQGLPWLLTGLQLIEKDMLFLQDNPMSTSLQENYQNLFKEHATSWNPLWEALQEQLSNEKHVSLFKKARQDFNQMMSTLDAGDFSTAKAHVLSSAHDVRKLMSQVFVSDPFQEMISKLLSDFSLASLQDPLEGNTLLFLLQELREATLPKGYEVLEEGMNAIRDNLEHSLASTQKQENILAQMYFNEAWQQGKRIHLLLKPNLRDDPLLILVAGIDEQQHALTQARLLSLLEEKQGLLPEMATTFVISSQQYLLAFGDYFYNSAYAKQRADFDAEVPEGSKDMRCQYHPWHEVFPLFQQGIDTIRKINKTLKAHPIDLNTAMQNQEQVLILWSKALDQLKAPKNSESCHVTPLVNEPGQKISVQSFEDIARLIEQMNAEDQKPKEPPTTTKEGLRPW